MTSIKNTLNGLLKINLLLNATQVKLFSICLSLTYI